MNLSTASLIAIGVSFLFLLAGFATLNVNLLIIGIVGLLVFGLIRVGFEEGRRRDSIQRRAGYAKRCDWCGNNLDDDRISCSSCGDVFCSNSCFYNHVDRVHKEN
jgi:hypothetical protein